MLEIAKITGTNLEPLCPSGLTDTLVPVFFIQAPIYGTVPGEGKGNHAEEHSDGTSLEKVVFTAGEQRHSGATLYTKSHSTLLITYQLHK